MNDQELKRAQINHFKNELKSVKFFLMQAEIYKHKCEEANHMMKNIKSPGDCSEKCTSSSTFDERFTYWLRKKQEAQYEYQKYQARVDDVMNVLDKMDIKERKILTDLYIRKHSFDSVCLDNYVTRNELQYFVDNTILLYLNGINRKRVY